MGAFKYAAGTMIKRPFIILFFGVISFIFCLLDYFNPIYRIAASFFSIGRGNIFDNIMSFFQLVYSFVIDRGITFKVLLYFIGLLAAVSVLAGAVLSGYLNVINNALERKPRIKGEFLTGLVRYFFRISSVSFKALLACVVFIILMVVASVPAIILTRTLITGSRPELYVTAVLVDIITVGVLFFGCMFFRIYILFWYPAVYNTGKRAFLTGKRVSDSHFWSIAGRFIIFDLLYIVLQLAFVSGSSLLAEPETGSDVYKVILFTINWLFKTILFASLITYVFSAFKMYKGRWKTGSQEDEPI